MQEPARTVEFFPGGLVLGTGGGLVFFSPPDSMESPLFIPIDGEPRSICIRGKTAYIAAFTGGLRVFDLSNRTQPREVYSFPTPKALGCTTAGGYLVLIDLVKGLYVLDLDDPGRPGERYSRSTEMPARYIASEGDLLAALSQKSVYILRVREDGALQHMTRIKHVATLKKALLQGGILYLLSGEGDIHRWNLADPSNPSQLPVIAGKKAKDLAIEGPRGFMLTESSDLVPFTIDDDEARETGKGRPGSRGKSGGIEIGKPLKLKPKRGGLTGRTGGHGGADYTGWSSITFSGDRLAALAAREGLFLYGTSNREARLIGRLPTRGFAIDLVAEGGFLYLANGSDGVRIGKVSNDGTIDWIGHFQTLVARDVALSGNMLVVADGYGGLKTVDVSDPGSPVLLGQTQSPYYLSAVILRGSKAYLAGGLGGMEVVDVSNPRSPKLTWRKDFSEVRGLDVDDEFLYFADGYEGFRIFSLAGRGPSSLSLLDTPGWNCDCFVIGDTAYLADGGRGIRAVDISDRRKPKELGAVSLGVLTREIHALDGIVFAAAHTRGIAAIDVTDPSRPFVSARYRTVDDARGVFADGRFVYLASGSGGVYIFRYVK